MFYEALYILVLALSTRHGAAFVVQKSSASAHLRFPLLMASSDAESSFSTTTNMIDGPTLPAQDTTTKRLFMLRHGEVINPGGDRPVFYGSQDVSLSDLGKLEAQAAAAYLQQFSLDAVFCSPLRRAMYGAKKVADAQPNVKSVTALEGFTELDRGAWRGKTTDEIGADLLARFDACDESATPDGGESFPQLKVRVLEALDEALQQLQPGQAGAIVSHLQVTRSILSQALGIPTEKMTQLPIATASISCVDYTADNNQPAQVHFQSFKPEVGLRQAKDAAN